MINIKGKIILVMCITKKEETLWFKRFPFVMCELGILSMMKKV